MVQFYEITSQQRPKRPVPVFHYTSAMRHALKNVFLFSEQLGSHDFILLHACDSLIMGHLVIQRYLRTGYYSQASYMASFCSVRSVIS